MPYYSFPPNTPFIHQLAAHIAKEQADANTLILLPSKRSCQSLTSILTREYRMRELPMIIALGELPDHPITQQILRKLAATELLAPPAPAIKRQLMLTKLCMAQNGQGLGYNLSPAQALELAGALCALLDEFQRQNVDTSKLRELVPDEYAIHWQQILQFLNIITSQWPRILQTQGQMDPVARRNQIFEALIAYWRSQPPKRIIIAGSTGSNQIVANMMQFAATLKNGQVILPSLPVGVDAEYWCALGTSHPHYYIAKLLEASEVALDQVSVLDYTQTPASHPDRSHFLYQSFIPHTLAYRWVNQPPIQSRALENVAFIEASTDLNQARQIAVACELLLKQAQVKTICIISERPSFTKLLGTVLRGSGLHFDSSEGQNLAQNPWAIWYKLLVNAALNPANPIFLLAVLKHPFAQDAEATIRQKAELLEVAVLRKNTHMDSIASMMEELQVSPLPEAPEIIQMLQDYLEKIKPFHHLLRHETNYKTLLQCHMECAGALSEHYEMDGELKQELTDYLLRLLPQTEYIGAVDAAGYASILDTLLSRETAPLATQNNSNIRILPSEEARLETADAMIIADFNQGVWPPEASINPWLSRSMQMQLGFDLDHMQASRMAHDLMMLSHAKHLIITRPLMDSEQNLTRPSPWLLRMQFYLKSASLIKDSDDLLTTQYQQTIEQATYQGAIQPESQPMPTPPAAARPDRISITDLELLQRDPYSIYAKYILQLKPLDELTSDSNSALYGQVLHKILEVFCVTYPKELPEQSELQFESIIQPVLHGFKVSKPLAKLWTPKLTASMKHFYNTEMQRRPMMQKVIAEERLCAQIRIGEKNWNIYGRADRLELYQDGTSCLIDYKTGYTPPKKDLSSFLAIQLTAGAFLAAQQLGAKVDKVEYWKITGNSLEIKPTLDNMLKSNELEKITSHIRLLLAKYDDAATPYTAVPDPAVAPAYPAYDQLERIKEWSK